ncbi:MAG: adenosine kinase [Caulobacterales bacterium 32-69-10]|nr:MAG: adenosine kinase [Caulobacterales bacterium 32-69-10]
MAKGGMSLIDETQAEAIYAAMGPAIELSGGSAGNTIAGLASLGSKCGYIGKVKDDQLGKVFRHDITAAGVAFPTPPTTDGPATARCLILVTPDAQRTMNTFLGACVNLHPEDIDEALISSAKVTYLEGYLYDPPHAQEAFRKAAAIARGAGRKVALTLSDSFCVVRHREAFLDLLRTVDILFANEAELCALFESEDFDAAVELCRGQVPLAAVTRSEKGAVVINGFETVTVKAAPVARIVDTTGAGDLFAAGFLHGLTRDLPLAECGRLGALAAAEIISHYGGRPETPLSDYVKG